MKELKTYICGCVKDCEPYLKPIFQNIRKITQQFSDFRIIIAYDESSDYSLNILHKIRKTFPDGKMTILMEDTPLTPIRTQNIANARNRILTEIRQDNHDSQFEYFIMMDMDNVCSGNLNISVLDKYLHCERIDEPLKWDALTFNRTKYYDIWALSIKPYTFSCWHYDNAKNVVNTMKSYIKTKLTEYGDKNELLPCISAFNGFGIYRTAKYINIQYEWNIHHTLAIYPKNMIDIMSRHVGSEPISRIDDCEHRFFHISASKMNGARIFISPLCLFV